MKLDLNDMRGVQLLADWVDAERCFAIMGGDAAIDRPARAWDFLPYGLDVYDTLTRLETEPVERNDELHALYMEIITRRRVEALAAWTLHQRKDAHVH